MSDGPSGVSGHGYEPLPSISSGSGDDASVSEATGGGNASSIEQVNQDASTTINPFAFNPEWVPRAERDGNASLEIVLGALLNKKGAPWNMGIDIWSSWAETNAEIAKQSFRDHISDINKSTVASDDRVNRMRVLQEHIGTFMGRHVNQTLRVHQAMMIMGNAPAALRASGRLLLASTYVNAVASAFSSKSFHGALNKVSQSVANQLTGISAEEKAGIAEAWASEIKAAIAFNAIGVLYNAETGGFLDMDSLELEGSIDDPRSIIYAEFRESMGVLAGHYSSEELNEMAEGWMTNVGYSVSSQPGLALINMIHARADGDISPSRQA